MTSTDENLSTDAATRLRRRPLTGYQNPQELERRKQGARRLKEMLSSIPFHQQNAALDPEGEEAYWLRLHASCINL